MIRPREEADGKPGEGTKRASDPWATKRPRTGARRASLEPEPPPDPGRFRARPVLPDHNRGVPMFWCFRILTFVETYDLGFTHPLFRTDGRSERGALHRRGRSSSRGKDTEAPTIPPSAGAGNPAARATSRERSRPATKGPRGQEAAVNAARKHTNLEKHARESSLRASEGPTRGTIPPRFGPAGARWTAEERFFGGVSSANSSASRRKTGSGRPRARATLRGRTPPAATALRRPSRLPFPAGPTRRLRGPPRHAPS